MGFFVIECQTNGDTASTIPVWYADKAQAESKYHQILSAAATSSVEKHGAILLNDDFRTFKRELYDRTNPEEEIVSEE